MKKYLALNTGGSDGRGALIEMQIRVAIRCNRRNDMAGSGVGTRIQRFYGANYTCDDQHDVITL